MNSYRRGNMFHKQLVNFLPDIELHSHLTSALPRVKAFFLCRLPKGCVKNIKRKMSFFDNLRKVPKATGQYVNIYIYFFYLFSGLPASFKTKSCERRPSSIQGNLCRPVCFNP